MIHKIYASDNRFKSIKFTEGLNVILADRQEESGEKDSRNGLGKSTFINILHFYLGSNLNKKLLPVDDISDWTFFIEVDLCGERIVADRSIVNNGIVSVDGNLSSCPIQPEKDENDGVKFYRLDDWRKLLGICLFGVPNTKRTKFSPTFRTLISYFARTGIDAYSKPFTYFRNQKAWQTQIANAFFLGLNWEHASTVQELKDKHSAINALNKAIKAEIVISKGELEAIRVRLEREILQEKQSLATFKVHPQYQEFQQRANLLTEQLHSLSNKKLILQKKLTRYEQSVSSENVPDRETVTKLYEEAGVYFGDSLKKSLDEVSEFHISIIENRKSFLAVEIQEIKNQITNNNEVVEGVTAERTGLMRFLETHGALEEFTLLHETIVEKKQQIESVKTKIAEIQEVSKHSKKIKAERIEIDLKIIRDYEQSIHEWEKAVAEFNVNSQALYNEPGNLIINVSEKGNIKTNAYSFDVEIPRSNSEGVGKMKIFCYDLMLVDLFAQKDKINFLVHDSTMFDGVDSRQIAHALELAAVKSIEHGFQYICAFNSDMLPESDFSKDFKIHDFVRLTLTDKEASDCLMGFRFNE